MGRPLRSYTIEMTCEECGGALEGGVSPGEMIFVPECDWCEKEIAVAKKAEEVWPTTADLLAVYGAPYNWPVQPVLA